MFLQLVTLILARTEAGVNKTLSGTMCVNVGTAMKGGIAQTVRKYFIISSVITLDYDCNEIILIKDGLGKVGNICFIKHKLSIYTHNSTEYI